MTALLTKYLIAGFLLLASVFGVWFSGRQGAKKDAAVKDAQDDAKRTIEDAAANIKAVDQHAATVEKANEIQASVNSAPGSAVDRLRESKWNTDNTSGKGN